MFDQSSNNKYVGLASIIIGGLLLAFALQELGVSRQFLNIVLLIIGIKLVMFGFNNMTHHKK